MGPEQLIKTATGQRRRRLRDEARSRRQWRHPVLRSGGLLALGGCSRGQRSSAVVSISVTTAAIAGFVQLRRGCDHQVRLGAEQSEDDGGCLYDQQSGFEYSDTGSGPARRLRRQYPRDRAAACVVQRLGADERGPRGWQYARP